MIVYKLGDTGYFPFFTRNTSNVLTAADALPAAVIYTGPNLAAQTALVTATVTAATGQTGGYVVSQALTAGNGFAAGTVYHIKFTYAVTSNLGQWMSFLVA